MTAHNRFILVKCIVTGAFTFPTPFLIFFYVFNLTPDLDWLPRSLIVMFLFFAGGLIGMFAFHKDRTIDAMKDWLPSTMRK